MPVSQPAAPAAPHRHGGPPPHAAAQAVETSIEPCTGWHVTHSFYALDRGRLAALSAAEIAAGVEAFAATLDPTAPHAPRRLQTWVVPGHKADFGVVAMDPSPLTPGPLAPGPFALGFSICFDIRLSPSCFLRPIAPTRC